MSKKRQREEFSTLSSMNGKNAIWIHDRVSVQQIFKPFIKYFEPLYAHIFLRDGELLIVDKQEDYSICEAKAEPCQSIEAIMDLLKQKGSLTLVFSDWKMEEEWELAYQGDTLLLNNESISLNKFEAFLKKEVQKCSLVLINRSACNSYVASQVEQSDNSEELSDCSDGQIINFTVIKRIGSSAEVCERRLLSGKPITIDDIKQEAKRDLFFKIEETLVGFVDFSSQLIFLEFKVLINDKNKFKIVGISEQPEYQEKYPFSEKTQTFLLEQLEAKQVALKKKTKQSFVKRTKGLVRRVLIKFRGMLIKKAFPKGLMPYQAVHYVRNNIKDYRTKNGMTFVQKRWAHKNGYLSWRVPQYGITEETKKNVISDFEYRYLRHINNRYMFWLKDKLTPKYTCSDFNECFPEYYYCTVKSGANNKAVKLMDCPDDYGAEIKEILHLAQEKKILAMKPDEGSHGEGFYCLEWKEKSFFLNNKPATEEQVLKILSDTRNQYLITEYIVQHPEMARLYPNSVNTLRLTVFKKDGRNAQVGNAYLRVGSSKTNGVDNIGAGGMMAYVNVETGYYHDAVYLKGNEIISCPIHPDTGELIQGYIPNWEYVKAKVIEIANSLPELEYFGFDVAITEDGLKLPEINTFPDFPRLDKLTPATMDYLLHKLERKKRMYGYDKKPCKTLFKFQERKYTKSLGA